MFAPILAIFPEGEVEEFNMETFDVEDTTAELGGYEEFQRRAEMKMLRDQQRRREHRAQRHAE